MLDSAFLLFIVLAPGVVALTGLTHKLTGDRFVMVATTGTVLTCGALALYNLFALAFHWGSVGGAEETVARSFQDIHL
ncbi:MAG: NADH-quinone oxidoreductase subunit L, partial [Pseudomonadota bacterium]